MSIQNDSRIKKYAIRNHRKMWKWIANKIDKAKPNTYFRGIDLVFEYLNTYFPDMEHICFCCEYASYIASDQGIKCFYCPILWGTESKYASYYCEYGSGLYSNFMRLSELGNWKEAAKIARKIANLPSKDEIEISR